MRLSITIKWLIPLLTEYEYEAMSAHAIFITPDICFDNPTTGILLYEFFKRLLPNVNG